MAAGSASVSSRGGVRTLNLCARLWALNVSLEWLKNALVRIYKAL